MDFNWVVTLVNAVMAVIPSVTWWYFPAFVLPGIWVACLVGLVLYIDILGGENDRILKSFTNAFWIANVLATIAFMLTRESLIEGLGWFLVGSVVFEGLFIWIMAVRRQWERAERWSLRWMAAGSVGIGLLLIGYPFDVQYNLTLGRLMFLQKPRLFDPTATAPWRKVFGGDYTLTANLKRNIFEGVVVTRGGAVGFVTWQGAEAYFICKHLVHRADPGHCGKLPA